MAGGIYAALSGLKAQTGRLDRLATDIANAGTTGYKAETATTMAVERDSFDSMLDAAVDVVAPPGGNDFRTGAIAPTGRDLDLAIDGDGFFAVETPGGIRYTRNGHFTRSPDGTLTASDGSPVLGTSGGKIMLPPGQVVVKADGSLSVGAVKAGQIGVFAFDDISRLERTDGVRFRAPDGVTANPADEARVQTGCLEQSNVSLPLRMAQLADVARGFEGLQRGISVLMNDIDGRAITELGRR